MKTTGFIGLSGIFIEVLKDSLKEIKNQSKTVNNKPHFLT
jgi:hypothetical protein